MLISSTMNNGRDHICINMHQMNPQMKYERNQLYLARSKLKASSKTSALLSGFAMIAMVELEIKKNSLPEWLIVIFSICTVILVSVHLLALMISTCLLPHVEAAAGRQEQMSAEQEQLLNQNYIYQNPTLQNYLEDEKNTFQKPHLHMKGYINIAWMCSTVFGIILFMLEITLIVWLQFYPISANAAYIATALLVPILAIFFGVITKFYKKLFDARVEAMREELAMCQMFDGLDKPATEGNTTENQSNNGNVAVP